MKIEQIYTGCLAQGAYYIRSGNEVAIIDPLREVGQYIEKANADGVSIKYVFETHFHADFVSGHLDLAAKTGATIVYGPTARPSFSAHVAFDDEVFRIGSISIKVLHTPGHTMESATYLLLDEHSTPRAIFTGDTLFLGDVGRPDLAQKAASLTKEELAGLLYDSLRSKIMTLPGDIIVYPGHGAGSACGKSMMKETMDTLANQLKVNYALREGMTKDEFISDVLEGLETPPAYFPENVKMNKEGYNSIYSVLAHALRPLDPKEFDLLANETGALVLDTRDSNTFSKAFIPNSINIGIDGNFAPWVGALIPGVDHPLLVVADPGREEEVITRLARVGFDNVIGYLAGGFEAWRRTEAEVDSIPSVSASDFARLPANKRANVIDVRKHSEYDSERLLESRNIPLEVLNRELAGISKHEPVYVHCAGGYRSMIACSMLKARGWNNLVDISGGFKALAETNIPKTSFACQSKSSHS